MLRRRFCFRVFQWYRLGGMGVLMGALCYRLGDTGVSFHCLIGCSMGASICQSFIPVCWSSVEGLSVWPTWCYGCLGGCSVLPAWWHGCVGGSSVQLAVRVCRPSCGCWRWQHAWSTVTLGRPSRLAGQTWQCGVNAVVVDNSLYLSSWYFYYRCRRRGVVFVLVVVAVVLRWVLSLLPLCSKSVDLQCAEVRKIQFQGVIRLETRPVIKSSNLRRACCCWY